MKNSKYLLTAILILFACCFMVAQGPPGFSTNGGDGDTVDDVAPIPGIIAAAAVGLFIGARKMYNNRNK